MKRQKRYLLLSLFAFISLINTAFIFTDSKDSMLNLPIQSLEAPPQYKAQNLSFYEKITMNTVLKKSRKDGKKPVNLKKIAKQSMILGGIAQMTGLASLLIAGIFPSATLLVLALTLIIAIVAITKARYVEGSALGTTAQKSKSEIGRKSSFWAFFNVIVCALFLLIFQLLKH
jgi:hypothetical protein